MTSSNKYSTEFKHEAISPVKDQGYTYADAGRVLSVSSNLISRWCKEHDSGTSVFQSNSRLTPDQQRIHELEKQVRRLEMEKAILKKATAYFAKDL